MANLNPEPLEHGALAPEFALESTDGRIVKRSHFRNKQALVLVFFQPTAEAVKLLQHVSRDEPEYKELNALVIGIGRTTRQELEPLTFQRGLSMMLLADADSAAWKAYAGTDASGYGVFVLDLYGGVDTQKVAADVAGLPDAATILEWTRGAQYRCTI
jgi:peroxiredoxin